MHRHDSRYQPFNGHHRRRHAGGMRPKAAAEFSFRWDCPPLAVRASELVGNLTTAEQNLFQVLGVTEVLIAPSRRRSPLPSPSPGWSTISIDTDWRSSAGMDRIAVIVAAALLN